MQYAICRYAASPVRLEPDHKLEMVSQLLFGDAVKVISDESNGWLFIEKLWDGYNGWIRANQLKFLTEPLPENTIYTGDWVNEIYVNGEKLMIPYACNLAAIKYSIEGYQVTFAGKEIDAASMSFCEENIIKIASPFLNTPYLWGGKSIFGIDCSGFVQTVFKLFNIKLLRDARQQVTQGTEVPFLQMANCGDVAFFDDADGEIIHVGILLSPNKIIHASGNVRIDKIDNKGIVHVETGKRTHQLRIITRMV